MNPRQSRWLRRLGIAAALVAVFFLGLSLRSSRPPEADHLAHTAKVAETATWTCSMHPQIRLPDFGPCPICGMDLIPVAADAGGDDEPRALSLSPSARKIAEIETTPVARRAVETSFRAVGKLEAAETGIREIAARVPGRIDRLYIDYTGVPVEAGEKLFDLYSPELYSAQEELIQSVRASSALALSGLESTRRSADGTIAAARERLRLWGLTTAQVEDLEKRGVASEHVTIVAPIGGVVIEKDAHEGAYVQTGMRVYTIADLSVLWLRLDVYESDLAGVKLGQTVEFETDAYPGRAFQGKVSFVDPVLDERSRSVKVRVDVTNHEGRLKPGMFARAVIQAAVRGEDGELPLVIPASSPLVTGTRAVVYVADSEERGRFHGREIVLGPKAGDFYVVREGLREGELIVSNGSFKIDSALQIQAKKSMMNTESGGAAPGHRDGEDSSAPAGKDPMAVEAIVDVPQEFRIQMDDLLADYFHVSRALSHDDFASAGSSARGLREALRTVDENRLSSAGQAMWAKARGELEKNAEAIVSAADITGARNAFYGLSVAMIGVVRAFGASGKTPVLLYHCPMAMDGAGADWLQASPGTENPYYGAAMFKCGSEKETLVGGSVGNRGSGRNHD